MKVESILDRVAAIPDDKLRDDDHLDRPGLTDEEATRGFAELYQKYKDQPAAGRQKSKDFAQGIINVLNSPSLDIY